MPVKYSASQSSYAKVVVVVALFTSMATAGPMFKEITLSSNASDAINATFVPDSSKQHFEPNADTIVNDHADEERARPPRGKGPSERIVEFFGAKDQNDVNDAFVHLDVDLRKSDFLRSEAIMNWRKFVKSKYSHFLHEARLAAMFATLKRYCQGDELGTVLVAGAKKIGEKKFARMLLDIQVREWVHDGKAVDWVFERLELDQTVGTLFQDPLCFKWVDFASLRYLDSNTANEKMAETLRPYFEDDDHFDKFLVAETMTHGQKSIAGNLLDVRVRKWQDDGKLSDWVFERLELYRTGETLFRHPLSSKWKKFAESKYSDDAYKEMVLTLTHYYNDDDLDRFLIAGAITYGKRSLAGQLLNAQVEMWASPKKDPANTFLLLRLDPANGNPFRNPLFSIWVKFVKSCSLSSVAKNKAMISTLKRYYETDDALDEALVECATTDGTKGIALELLSYRIQMWRDDSKDADYVFTRLQLGKTQDGPFQNPLFPWWVDCVEKRYPGEISVPIPLKYSHFMMLRTLEKQYPDALANVLDAGTKTEGMSNLAKSLQSIFVRESLAKEALRKKSI